MKKEKQANKNSRKKELAAKPILNCKTTVAHKFRRSLTFIQYHVILQYL